MKFSIPLLLVFVICSCAPSTPQARIEKNPEKFAALSASQQSLVQQGEIVPGMSPDAVELAWGLPSRRLEGSHHGKPMDRWDYTGTRPIYVNSFYGAYGYGPYGGYGPYNGFGYNGYALGPEVAYIPYQVASVRFIDRRVDSWERVR